MQYKFVIKGKLPGLNDYLKAERSFHRGHSCGNDMKQEYQMLVSNAIRASLKRQAIKSLSLSITPSTSQIDGVTWII